jgi:hypothetical protein
VVDRAQGWQEKSDGDYVARSETLHDPGQV